MSSRSSPPPDVITLDSDDDEDIKMAPNTIVRAPIVTSTTLRRDDDDGFLQFLEEYPRNMTSDEENIVAMKFLCILCQRVCNTPYVMKCRDRHRFCERCLIPRYNSGNISCPRCNFLCEMRPSYCPVFGELIHHLRLDTRRVRYIPEVRYYRQELDPNHKRLPQFPLPMIPSIMIQPREEEYPSSILDKRMFYTVAQLMEIRLRIETGIRDWDIRIERYLADKKHTEQFLSRKKEISKKLENPNSVLKNGDVPISEEERKRMTKRLIPTVTEMEQCMARGEDPTDIQRNAKDMADYYNYDYPEDPSWKRNVLYRNYLSFGGVIPENEPLVESLKDVENWKGDLVTSPLAVLDTEEIKAMPFEGQRYKYFLCNKYHVFPNPPPPRSMTGFNKNYHNMVQKVERHVRTILENETLTKRQKKIKIHQIYQKHHRTPYDEYPSSEDDDYPPLKTPEKEFNYPSNYRLPRVDWKEKKKDLEKTLKDIKAEIQKPRTREQDIEEIKKVFDMKFPKRKTNLPDRVFHKDWHGTVRLVRFRAGSNSFLTANEWSVIDIGINDDATVGHLFEFLFHKLSKECHITVEKLQEEFFLNFFEVNSEHPGHKLVCLEVPKEIKQHSTFVHALTPQAPPPPPPPKQKTNALIPPKIMEMIKGDHKPKTSTFNVGGKEITVPFTEREPTVREVALSTMGKYMKEEKTKKVPNTSLPPKPVVPFRSIMASLAKDRVDIPPIEKVTSSSIVTPPKCSAPLPTPPPSKQKKPSVAGPLRAIAPTVITASTRYPNLMPRPVNINNLVPVGKLAVNGNITLNPIRSNNNITIVNSGEHPEQQVFHMIPITQSNQVYSHISTPDGRIIPLQGQLINYSPQKNIQIVQGQTAVFTTPHTEPRAGPSQTPQMYTISPSVPQSTNIPIAPRPPAPIKQQSQQQQQQQRHSGGYHTPPGPSRTSDEKPPCVNGPRFKSWQRGYGSKYPPEPLDLKITIGELRARRKCEKNQYLPILFSMIDKVEKKKDKEPKKTPVFPKSSSNDRLIASVQ